jgi:hypothetical protein
MGDVPHSDRGSRTGFAPAGPELFVDNLWISRGLNPGQG